VPRLAKDGIPLGGQGRRGSYQGLCLCLCTKPTIHSKVTYNKRADKAGVMRLTL
jgi:hypothetical protein